MSFKMLYQSTEKAAAFIFKWVGYLSAVGIAIGVISILLSNILTWMNQGVFSFVRSNLIYFWLTLISAMILSLWMWTATLYRRYVSGFHDDFNNLDNWDFIGPWHLVDKGTLTVTGSDEGGITKIGSHWENYTFTFKARIINECLGVIVRAQDLHNYHMFQIRPDKIRPHFKSIVPIVLDERTAKIEDDSVKLFRPVNYALNWLHDGVTTDSDFRPSQFSTPLEDWFDVRINVQGQAVKIWINNELQFERPSFLKIPMGKVGFRNSGAEEGYIRNVKVELHH